MMLRSFCIFVSLLLLISCKKEYRIDEAKIADPSIFHQSVKALSDVILHDIFSPPVASRIYAYACVGAYESARSMDSTYRSFSGQIEHLPKLPEPIPGQKYCFPMVSTITFLTIGKNLIFSEDTLQKQIDVVLAYYKSCGIPDEVFERSVSFANEMANAIMSWSNNDNYKQSRSFPKYSLQKDVATWKPTPPAYMDAIEPSWNKIRPFVMDSASQFKPLPPTPFDIENKNSPFYKEVMETYMAVKNASEEEKEIANFWDCNPYKLNVTGHIMHATKKITPGGHWIGIIGLACRKNKVDFLTSVQSYALVSLGLADAFISCWDEKYRSVLVRPETVINEYIDANWVPLLQTPPFPEYTSGHSVASSASAIILTSIFGDNFAYQDSTEVEFGLPVRSFSSFQQAADEASISRLYGGIHYKPAIVNGVKQGKMIGQLVLDKIKVK